MTKEEAIICLKGIKDYGRDTFTEQSDWQNSLDIALKALEQQPNDDCVSRQAILDKAYAYGNGLEPEGYCVNVEDIQALPPATPTHGKCKDCTNYVVGALDEEICLRGHELIHKDFYCADFKKRGTENG